MVPGEEIKLYYQSFQILILQNIFQAIRLKSIECEINYSCVETQIVNNLYLNDDFANFKLCKVHLCL